MGIGRVRARTRRAGGRARVTKAGAGVALCAIVVSAVVLQAGPASAYTGGSIYAYWNFAGAPSVIWDLDQKIKITDRAPKTFWASQFVWGTGSGGYVGLQTDGQRWDGSVGDMFIFSLWAEGVTDTPGATTLPSPYAAEAGTASGARCGVFHGEGTGYSCRMPFPIVLGREYKLRVWRSTADSVGQWWKAEAVDKTAGVTHYLGRIRMPLSKNRIGYNINWTEDFSSTPPSSCDNVPWSAAIWTRPLVNQQADTTYQYKATFDYWKRGTCTGGNVTAYEWGSPEGTGRKLGMGGAVMCPCNRAYDSRYGHL